LGRFYLLLNPLPRQGICVLHWTILSGMPDCAGYLSALLKSANTSDPAARAPEPLDKFFCGLEHPYRLQNGIKNCTAGQMSGTESPKNNTRRSERAFLPLKPLEIRSQGDLPTLIDRSG
jgi:hypothetical protein